MSRCKRPDGSPGWSAPSAFACGGGGGGLEFGGAMQHLILVLNTDEAVAHFTGRGLNMSFTLQAALGPHQAGRCVEGGVRLSFAPGPTAAALRAAAAASGGALVRQPGPPPPHVVGSYVYGEAGGFFLGAGIQAGLVMPREWENASYYGVDSAPAADILSGALGLAAPWPEVSQLHAALAMAEEPHADWGSLATLGPGSSPKLGSDAEAGEFELFVPGLVCLLGDEGEWAAAGAEGAYPPSASLVVGSSEQGLYARARRRRGFLVLRASAGDGSGPGEPPLPSEELPMSASSLAAAAAAGGPWAPAAGVASRVMALGYAVDGLEIDIYRCTLPAGRCGTSPARAPLCVLLARAFSRAYGLGISLRGEMELAFQGEQLTPSRGFSGRRDSACAYGARPMLLRHDDDRVEVEELAVGGPFYWVLAHPDAGRGPGGGAEEAVGGSPRPAPLAPAAAAALGERTVECVQRAVTLLAAGDAPALGALLSANQAELDAAAAAAAAPQLAVYAAELRARLAHPSLDGLALGGKGCGSVAEGALQLLCADEASQAAAAAVLRSELGMVAHTLTVVRSNAPPKAGVAAEDTLLAGAMLGGRPAGGSWLAKTRSQLELVRKNLSGSMQQQA